jgi:hypothetical protein
MPSIIPVIDKLEDVAEPLRAFYEPKDGKFQITLSATPPGYALAADLATANGKVVEFRNTNIELKKTVDELTPLRDKFKDIDPEKAREALAQVEKLNKKGVKDVDNDLQTMITAATKPLMDKIEQITASSAEERKRADNLTLRSVIHDKFIKAGGHADAVDFIMSRVGGTFVVENGLVKAAPNQFSTDRPTEALSVDEWMTRQTKEVGYVFKPSNGGGASPANGNGARQVPAGVTVLKDPTAQQLGENAKGIREGKVKLEYSSDASQQTH